MDPARIAAGVRTSVSASGCSAGSGATTGCSGAGSAGVGASVSGEAGMGFSGTRGGEGGTGPVKVAPIFSQFFQPLTLGSLA